MFEIFTSGEAWIALLTLTFLEIVLGVDNIIFISIITNKLPADKREFSRRLGLLLALVFRIILLIAVTWLIHHLTEPLFYLSDIGLSSDLGFSIREIILILGGLFLLAKSTSEIHHNMEGEVEETDGKPKKISVLSVIVPISLLDIVFSFDSILTAVGLTEEIMVMIIAVAIAIIVMMMFAGKISNFISKNPTLEILALSFLILIGFMLILEGAQLHVPKGYIYFAVFFSLLVEALNIRIRKKKKNIRLKKRWHKPNTPPTEKLFNGTNKPTGEH